VSARAVCISRSFGAEGEEVGRLVADRLGYRYVDEEVVALAAERGGIDPGVMADEEKRKGFVTRVLEQLATSGTPEAFFPLGPLEGQATSDEHRGLIREVVEEIGGRGNAVLVAHAASMALVGRAGVLRIFITASRETRRRRFEEASGLDGKQAEKRIRDEDAARADYFRRFYDVDRELPTHYDLVINTDALTVDEAADIVIAAAQRH
jgi:Cytidylate kinase-like family